MRRLVSGLVVALTLSVMVAGCSVIPPLACPAIGWSHTVTVVLDGAVEKVHTVELCIEDNCSITTDQLQDRTDEPLQIATAMPPDTPTSASPSNLGAPPIGARLDDHAWTFSLMMNAPTTVTVRALSVDDASIASTEVTLHWKRVGGSEQCGGPGEAAPVALSIPAE